MNKKWLVASLLMCLLPVYGYALNAQNEKMKSCNAQAKTQNLSGDARKSFMKTCLSSQPPDAPKVNSQNQKMKQCNSDAKAKGLTGTDRKTYMSACLKSSGG